jgi:hypothetical protein
MQVWLSSLGSHRAFHLQPVPPEITDLPTGIARLSGEENLAAMVPQNNDLV